MREGGAEGAATTHAPLRPDHAVPAVAAANPYRRDIDGLRAVAVASVVVYHGFPWAIPGGFVGVDIFFVISGYLIGGIILAETLAGSFRFSHFYARRARRILPALLVVAAATVAAGALLLNAVEYRNLAVEAIGALTGTSNLKFWWQNDYFSPSSELLPLLMTWSLGVEEQFYVLFPFLMVAIVRLPPRARAAALAALTVASFAWSAYLTPRFPQAAFYLLPTRAWELGAGALLAMARIQSGTSELPRGRAADALGIVGAALLIVAFRGLDGRTAFPGVAAALPVAATVALLAARNGILNRTLFASRPMVGVGLISYSWYLWHWPLLSLLRNASLEPSAAATLVALIAGFAAAIVSWRWVERPFRAARASAPVTLRRYAAVVGIALAGLGAIVVGRGFDGRLPASIRIAEGYAVRGRGSCLVTYSSDRLNDRADCMPAAPPVPAVALLGDSHAEVLSIGLDRASARNGYRLLQFVKAVCMPLAGYTTGLAGKPQQAATCARFLETATRRIAADPAIRIVVLAGQWPADDDPRLRKLDGLAVGAKAEPATAIAQGLGAMIDRLRRAGKRVVVMGDAPPIEPFDPMRAVMIRGMPARALIDRAVETAPFPQRDVPRAMLNHRFDRIRPLVRDVAARHGAAYVDTFAMLCGRAGCRYEERGVPLFTDPGHLSPAGVARIDWAAAGLPARGGVRP